jgi:RNA polymerase sigma factor (sigma-70 family)
MNPNEHVKSWTDTKLVGQCRDGDGAAWDELISRYGPMIYGISRRFRLTPEDCVDVFGQVCKILLENLAKIKSTDRLAGYVSTTTQRACLAVIRDRERRQRISQLLQNEPESTGPENDPEEIARTALRGFVVRRALDEQDERCRKLLWLLFFDDDQPDYGEISRKLKMPVASIGPTRSRCLERFRKTLNKLGFAEE